MCGTGIAYAAPAPAIRLRECGTEAYGSAKCGTEIAYGGTEIAYGGTEIAFGGTEIAYGGTEIAYGGTQNEGVLGLPPRTLLRWHWCLPPPDLPYWRSLYLRSDVPY
eukprot:2171221-Rhodomonas_salina.2